MSEREIQLTMGADEMEACLCTQDITIHAKGCTMPLSEWISAVSKTLTFQVEFLTLLDKEFDRLKARIKNLEASHPGDFVVLGGEE